MEDGFELGHQRGRAWLGIGGFSPYPSLGVLIVCVGLPILVWWGWLFLRTCGFLDQGFTAQIRPYFDTYRKGQEKKLPGNFSPEKATADCLEGLADRLKSSDIDPAFVMPNAFSQFDHTKWPENAALK